MACEGFTHKSNLLVLSFSYSPMLNPRAFRWTALAEEFAVRGVRVKVICSWQPGLPQRQMLNGVEVYRVGNRFIESLRACLARLRQASSQSLIAQPFKRSRTSTGTLGSWLWRQVAWPDTTCVWYGAARQKARVLLKETPLATVISVSPSFTAALAGYSVTKGNGLRWILDMGDPFSIADGAPANNFSIYQSLNQRVERALFLYADAVTITNNRIRDRYAAMYPESAGKMTVIPPLLDDRLLKPGVKEIPKKSFATVKILYVGTLYKKLRRPDFLLELFEGLIGEGSLTEPELHFLGNCQECMDILTSYKKRFGKRLQIHGMVSRKDTFLAIREADVVVNLGNTNNCQLPSKIIEYGAMGKPIVNIICTDHDPSKELLKNYHAVLNLHDSGTSPSAVQVALAAAFIQKSIGKNINVLDTGWIKQFRKDAIADQYAAVFFRGHWKNG